MERHPILSTRTANLIKRSRAALSHEIVDDFFEKFKQTMGDIPPENVYNYDETNLQVKIVLFFWALLSSVVEPEPAIATIIVKFSQISTIYT